MPDPLYFGYRVTLGATAYPLAAVNPWTVVLGDVNGDGVADLIVAAGVQGGGQSAMNGMVLSFLERNVPFIARWTSPEEHDHHG